VFTLMYTLTVKPHEPCMFGSFSGCLGSDPSHVSE